MRILHYRYTKILLLSLICIVAVLLRFYKLGQIPPSLDWDEASLGYNAYSILKTGKDEFGRSWPVSIRSFEDYKPALYTYSIIPFIWILGLNELAVRLPSAIFGLLTVFLAYPLSNLIFHLAIKERIEQKKITQLALLTALLLAISPWHIQFSRVAFEANLGLFWATLGIWLFLKGTENGKWFIITAISFVLSFYSYHSPRLVVPLLIFGWVWIFRRDLWNKRKWIVVSCIVTILMLVPFAKEAWLQGRARFMSVTVLNPDEKLVSSIAQIEEDQGRGNSFGRYWHNRRWIYFLSVAKGYLDHFNLDFLFLTGDAPNRHHAQDTGMLYLWEAPFVFIGLLLLIELKMWFLIWWYLVAPSASALTTGTPHAVRAMLYLPVYQLITSLGLMRVFSTQKLALVKYLFLILFAINIYTYLDMYYIHTPKETSKDWQFGFKQATEEITKYADSVDKIIVTYGYDQPHAFILFFLKIDPALYQEQIQGLEIGRMERSFGKFQFRNIDWSSDKYLDKTLLVGTAAEIPNDVSGLVKEIFFLDGTVAFRVVKS